MPEVMARRDTFVIGHPIAHSRSPMIHGYWLAQHGLTADCAYRAIDVAPEQLAGFFRDLVSGETGFVGGNVTIPHKQAAFALADRPDAIASALGAANTIWIENGKICASNTDGYGFLANLDAMAPGWDHARKHAVVLGAGGAARAIIHALTLRGFAHVGVFNRSHQRAADIAAAYPTVVKAFELSALEEALVNANLFVNTTSLGMTGKTALDIDIAGLPADCVVADIVYVPLETDLLARARKRGLRTADGLGMLLHQAVPGFERWYGKRPEVTAELRALVVDDITAGINAVQKQAAP